MRTSHSNEEKDMKADAQFSACRKYRYALWRRWDESKPYAMFVGLNPSTADEVNNDPTVIRCINFAKSWGYGGLCMANLFAYRATDSDDLMAAVEPVGSANDDWLVNLANDAGVVVAAWGNNGRHLNRSEDVVASLPNLHYLKRNKSGEPAHPLYLKSDLLPVPMSNHSTWMFGRRGRIRAWLNRCLRHGSYH